MGFANHPNLAHLNTFTVAIVQSLSDAQADFYSANGRYFQGLPLLGDQQPDGTADIRIDNASKPGDQDFSWHDFAPTIFKNNTKVPINVQIDVSESPDGWGWKLVGEIWIDGLGPDAYGNEGLHWMYIHYEGPAPDPDTHYDEWFVWVDAPF